MTDPVDRAREALVREAWGTEAHMPVPVKTLLAAFEQAVRAAALRIPEDSEFAGATPGPWGHEDEWNAHGVTAGRRGGHLVYIAFMEDGNLADQALIEAAHALLARVREQDRTITELREQLRLANIDAANEEAENRELREALAELVDELDTIDGNLRDGRETYVSEERVKRARAALGEGDGDGAVRRDHR